MGIFPDPGFGPKVNFACNFCFCLLLYLYLALLWPTESVICLQLVGLVCVL